MSDGSVLVLCLILFFGTLVLAVIVGWVVATLIEFFKDI